MSERCPNCGETMTWEDYPHGLNVYLDFGEPTGYYTCKNCTGSGNEGTWWDRFTGTKICSRCGKRVDSSNNYCSKCGNSL